MLQINPYKNAELGTQLHSMLFIVDFLKLCQSYIISKAEIKFLEDSLLTLSFKTPHSLFSEELTCIVCFYEYLPATFLRALRELTVLGHKKLMRYRLLVIPVLLVFHA